MKRALVLTPQPAGLGELLREALDTLGVDAAVYGDAAQALAAAETPFDLLVLDGDAAPLETLADVAALWRAHAPRGRLVCLLPENATPEWQATLRADRWLEKPLYLPAFLEAVAPEETEEAEEVAPQAQEAATLPPPPPWLADVTLAAQHLARLSLETAAQAAALVSREGALWAYAGELPQPAAEELAQLVAHHWGVDGGSGFARFVRLEAVQQDFLLYATPVAADLALAMVFEASVPFSRIRMQANRLAEALTQQAPEPPPPPPAETAPPPSGETDAPPQPAEAAAAAEAPATPAETAAPAADAPPPDLPPDDAADEPEEDLPLEASLPLFDDVPPPVPDAVPPQPVAPPPATPPPMEDPSTAPTVAVPLSSAQGNAPRRYAAPADPTLPVAVAPTPPADAPQEAAAPAAATQASLPPPATFARAELFYACVLIPRFPQDHLTGDLARDLGQWMPRIAMSLGWHLVHLAVRPNYLQWIVRVLPATSPADILRLVRQHTSRYIFSNYPRIAQRHVGDDFWAPGYLVLSQNKPVPTPTIEAFIRQTRRRQGLTP